MCKRYYEEKGLNISSYMEFVTSILFIDGKKPLDVNKEKLHTMTAQNVMSAPAFAIYKEVTIEKMDPL